MTISDWALIISIFSMLISLGGFVWNIWSKFIFPKAKIRVSFAVVHIIPPPDPPREYTRVNVTNFGPGEIIVDAALVRTKKRWYKRDGWGLINPIHSLDNPDIEMGPFAGGLPKKLSVAETFSLFFPHSAENFLGQDITRVGIQDSFGRNHWAPTAHVRKALEIQKRDFPK
ncbi:hypothetical protein [Sphingomonas sp. PAMC 26605]|uniref:hypothetical protein n=1 Tax=Sphingomonas sp. PAMC 26605 TaxID=1112214 RepID=UPI0012F50E38|nr:hypothetical protein [Sphingomonas sp. PAMC 26605]